MKTKKIPMICAGTISMAILVGCGASPSSSSSATSEASGQSTSLAAPETHPTGDIPDTQAFVTYKSPQGHYSLEVPEGWARTTNGANVQFVSKLDGVGLSLSKASSAPTVDSVKANQAASLEKSSQAVKISKIEKVHLQSGDAIRIDYSSNSAPDPVTGKSIRLEDNQYLFYSNGKLAELTLWAPYGADNVDQWNRMALSFRWQP